MIRRVAVIGAGTMGAEIAALAALGGYETALHDRSPAALKRARERLTHRLPQMERRGKIGPGAAAAALERLRLEGSLASAVAEADFVIEAVYEDLELKRSLFAELDRLAPPHAVLATNSSTIVSSRLADATRRPERVINMHFFTPPLVMEVVEVVQGPHVADETAAATMEVARRMNREPVLLRRECFGFVVNRVLGAVLNEALRIVEEGIATPEEVDHLVHKALGYPLPPFRTLDLVGNDVAWYVRRERARYTSNPEDGPSPLLTEKVEKGELGRKTGKGWYTYG
ncbi:MAG: 3-hydroxyacyl-CoA dehydrogenase family protein [Bacillota bacterium]